MPAGDRSNVRFEPTTLGERRVVDDARRDDGVFGGLLAPQVRLVDVAADFAHGGRAAGEIEVALVLDGHRNALHPLLVPVHVRVDHARHDVFAGGVDHGVWTDGRRRAWRRRRIGRARWRDARDQAVLDQDVHGPVRRLGVAVDHHGVLDQQALVARVVRGRRGCGGARSAAGVCAAIRTWSGVRTTTIAAASARVETVERRPAKRGSFQKEIDRVEVVLRRRYANASDQGRSKANSNC